MKGIFLVILLLPLCAFNSGEKFLSKIDLYQKDSYFKDKVFAEHDWKSFYKLKEVTTVIDIDRYDLHLMNAAIFFATNQLRETKGFKVLKFSSGLRDAAMIHSWQMVEKNFFNHFNSYNAALRSPDKRIKICGIEPNACAENIDMNFIGVDSNSTYLSIAQKIVEDLYESPPHRKNMLSKGYAYLGCGAMLEPKDKNGVHYIKATQDFSAVSN